MTTAAQPREAQMRHRPRCVSYGVIGAGTRAFHLVKHLAVHHGQLALRGVYDTDSPRAKKLVDAFAGENGQTYESREALLADPAVDWVLVVSPNHQHKDDILAAFDAGKHVFAEKPLATTVADCIAIYDAHRQRPELTFATGFVLRYTPIFRQLKQLLDSGAIGEIISVAASENITPAHGGHIMTCWRRYSEQSGSHMLEKCCHDIDLLLWFINALPTHVASFGGNDLFVPERQGLMDKFSHPETGQSIYLEWKTPTRDVQNPFTADKTVVDNQVAIMTFANNVRVTFQTTMNNAIPERRLYFSGSEGTLISEMYSQSIQLRRIGHDQPTQSWTFDGSGGHGGGDRTIMSELAEAMTRGAPVTCGGEEGLRSAVVSLAIEQARHANQVVDLRTNWRRLGLAEQLDRV